MMLNYLLAAVAVVRLTVPAGALDLPPDILPLGNLVLREDAKVDSLLWVLNATSPQGYDITFAVASDFFGLSPNNTVYLARPLSYQSNRYVQFQVSATDSVRSTTRKTFTVTVTSANLNSPVFERDTYRAEVDEDLPVNSEIFSVRVDDADYGNSRLVVTCIPNDNFLDACSLFGVRERGASNKFWEGQLYSQAPLNYETVKDVYQVKLSAFDGTYFTVKTFEINILHPSFPPEFRELPAATIKSNAPVGTFVAKVLAVDSNPARNRSIIYNIDSGSRPKFFTVDQWSGDVTLQQNIDMGDVAFLNGPIINITIIASSVIDAQNMVYGYGSKTASRGALRIEVIDVTTNVPRFDAATYASVVPENIANEQALPGLSMVVSTLGKGAGGMLSLAFAEPSFNDVFYILPASGLGMINSSIYVRNNSYLDYEKGVRRFDFRVVATYNSSFIEALRSNVTVVVRVENVYDQAPTFDKPSYSAVISLITKPGVIIAAFQAHSYESPQVFYSLSGDGSEKFAVGNTSGQLSLASCATGTGNCLGNEKDSYNLTLTASDSADRRLQTSVVLMIRVNASTLLPPVFTSSSYLYNARVGSRNLSTAAAVSAVSSYTPPTAVWYELQAGNYSDLFAIDALSGTLSATRPVTAADAGDSKEITVYVRAWSGGVPAIAQVIILVQAAPMTRIAYLQNYTASFMTSAPVGSPVIQVAARSVDPSTTIQYAITSVVGGDYDQFLIDSATGDIKIAKNFSFVGRRTYSLTVLAMAAADPANNATTYVLLTGSNIPSPYFSPSLVNASIPEDALVGSQVALLNAVTVDDSIRLAYELSEPMSAYDMAGNLVDKTSYNVSSLVALAPAAGTVALLLASSLNRRQASLIQLTLTVSDTSTVPPSAPGRAAVTIKIMAGRRYTPVFVQSVFSSTIEINQVPGTYVTTIRAIDNDGDTINYSLYGPNVNKTPVAVDAATGIITINSQVSDSFSLSQPLTFIVQAADSYGAGAFALASISVHHSTLGDLVFDQQYYVAVLRDPKTAPLATVHASTRYLATDYYPPQYDIRGESRFSINASSGAISLVTSTALENGLSPYMQFYVTAYQTPRRRFITGRSQSVPVYIIIPRVWFPRRDVYLTLPVNMPGGSEVSWAAARSSNYSAALSYALVLNPYNRYAIDKDTGRITIARTWPPGTPTNHYFVVSAYYPMGSSDNVTFHVTLTGLDAAPYWVFPSDDGDSVVMVESNSPGTVVTNLVQAHDDEGPVTYALLTENGTTSRTNEFSIDPNSGQIRSLIALAAESKSRYLLNLAATDSQNQTVGRFLYVKILKSNGINNALRFKKTDYFFSIPSGRKGVCAMNPGTATCGRVTVAEVDSGVTVSSASFVIAGSSFGCSFDIYPNGTIWTTSSSCTRSQNHTLLVLVPGQSGSFSSVHIHVSGSHYSGSLLIGTPVGSRVLDVDPFKGNAVTYSLGTNVTLFNDSAVSTSINGSTLLYIDSMTGSVFLAGELTAAWASSLLQFTVVLKDTTTGVVVSDSSVSIWLASDSNQARLLLNGQASVMSVATITAYLKGLLKMDNVFVDYSADVTSVLGGVSTSRLFEVHLTAVDSTSGLLYTQQQLTKLVKDSSSQQGGTAAGGISLAKDTAVQYAYIYITLGLISYAPSALPSVRPYVGGVSPVAAGSPLYYGLAAAVALLLLLLCLLLPLLAIYCCCCGGLCCCAGVADGSKLKLQHYAIINKFGGPASWQHMSSAHDGAMLNEEEQNYFDNNRYDGYGEEETKMDYVKTFLSGSGSSGGAGAVASNAGRQQTTTFTEEVLETEHRKGRDHAAGGSASNESERVDTIVSGLAPGNTTLVSEMKQSASAAASFTSAGASSSAATKGLQSFFAGATRLDSQAVFAAVSPRVQKADLISSGTGTFSHTATVRRPASEAGESRGQSVEYENLQVSHGSDGGSGTRGRTHRTVTETEIIEEEMESDNRRNTFHDHDEIDIHRSTGHSRLRAEDSSASAEVVTGQQLTIILDAQPDSEGMVAEDAQYEILSEAHNPYSSTSTFQRPHAGGNAAGGYTIELAGQPAASHLISTHDEYEVLQDASYASPYVQLAAPSTYYR